LYGRQSKIISHSVDIYSNENELGDTLGDTSKNYDFSEFLKSA